ncbi:DUF1565 domain-containing protein [Vacuolonema iberomarrocanum]|uniref:DUF1565 domain-containing protein n=1 Tax=Vacuolonema iberomarrocanum TaxID=3454632 RepID=UPI0019ECE754|nr:DUF1565 domain-containing protein [filamentous cyanobacterium LEGE 07170]
MGTFRRINGFSQRVNQGILVVLMLGGSIGWADATDARSSDAATQSLQNVENIPSRSIAQASDENAQANFQQMLFVDPVLGSDETGEGTLRSPFRSITHAVQFAEANTVIMLGAGTYSQRSGEQFPIGVPTGVRLVEMPNGTVTIRGQIVEGVPVVANPTPIQASESIEGVVNPAPLPVTMPDPMETTVPASFAPPVDIPATPDLEPAAVSIPGEPPIAASVSSTPQSTPTQRQTSSADASIEIPVPPPENPMPLAVGRSAQPAEQRPAPPSQPVAQSAPPPQVNAVLPRSAPAVNPNLLPVPDPDIPLGYVGDFPTVSIETVDVPSSPTNLPTAPTRTAARSPDPSLRYRVIVRLENDALRSWILSVVPDAFETTANGEPVMQIGAFQTVESAETAAEALHQSGVRAIIQEF